MDSLSSPDSPLYCEVPETPSVPLSLPSHIRSLQDFLAFVPTHPELATLWSQLEERHQLYNHLPIFKSIASLTYTSHTQSEEENHLFYTFLKDFVNALGAHPTEYFPPADQERVLSFSYELTFAACAIVAKHGEEIDTLGSTLTQNHLSPDTDSLTPISEPAQSLEEHVLEMREKSTRILSPQKE